MAKMDKVKFLSDVEIEGKLTVTSVTLKPSEGLTYELSEDETYATCTGLGGCTDTDILIASSYQGKPVTSIGFEAFGDCGSLTSITIPTSVTSIGDYAFKNCANLESITIPESVTSIGVGAFQDCSSLESITIPDSVESIGSNAFYNCSSLTSIEIPNSVIRICSGTFYCCSSLKSIEIPDSVTSIDYHAFYGCYNLESITILDSVTSIGVEAFYNCSSLKSITISDSVTDISRAAFSGCSSLTIYCEAAEQPDDWNVDWNPDNRPIVWGAALDILAVNDKLKSITLTYTNDTPMIEDHGGIAKGTTFDKIPIQDMLTMILYPYIDIDIGTVTANPLTGSYYVHNLPTLSSVTLTVKKNSATNLQFSLWDTTKNTQVGSTLTEANISNNKLSFSNLNYYIDTTRIFKIKYTYKGKGGVDSGEETVDIGTFTINFENPTMNNLSSNLSSYSWYNGQTASVTEITASILDLGSASATGGITKIELYKNGTKVGDSVSKPSLPHKFTVADSLTEGTTYKVKVYYNTRTGSSTTTSETSIEKDLTITFSRRAATINLIGLNSNTFSKLNPQSISGLSASFTKYSDKITSVKLLEGSSVKETKNISGYDSSTYSAASGTASFDYTKSNICTTISLKAEAYNGNTKVATSNTNTLTFYAPYCYGFVDPSITLDTIDRDILKNLIQTKNAPSIVSLDDPGAQRKMVYAIPNGNYSKVVDTTTGFDITDLFTIGNKTITFADNTTQIYQIFIFTLAAQASAAYKFS